MTDQKFRLFIQAIENLSKLNPGNWGNARLVNKTFNQALTNESDNQIKGAAKLDKKHFRELQRAYVLGKPNDVKQCELMFT